VEAKLSESGSSDDDVVKKRCSDAAAVMQSCAKRKKTQRAAVDHAARGQMEAREAEERARREAEAEEAERARREAEATAEAEHMAVEKAEAERMAAEKAEAANVEAAEARREAANKHAIDEETYRGAQMREIEEKMSELGRRIHEYADKSETRQPTPLQASLMTLMAVHNALGGRRTP
jgi:hypothetical protein